MAPEAKGQRTRLFLRSVGGMALSFGVFLTAGFAIRCDGEKAERYSKHSAFPMPEASTWKYSRAALALFLWTCLTFFGLVSTFFFLFLLPPSRSLWTMMLDSEEMQA